MARIKIGAPLIDENQTSWTFRRDSVNSGSDHFRAANSELVRLDAYDCSKPLCSNLSVVAFSETVRTFVSSNPSGAVASTSTVTET